jgi:hypothetical protein
MEKYKLEVNYELPEIGSMGYKAEYELIGTELADLVEHLRYFLLAAGYSDTIIRAYLNLPN